MKAFFYTPPVDFSPTLEVAGCYCAFEDKVLLVKRSPHKPQGDTWGIPGGKIEESETPQQALVREIYEEIGVEIKAKDLEEISPIYMRFSEKDYIFHRFYKNFFVLPQLHLNLEEHREALWVTCDEALRLPLMYGGEEALINYQVFLKNRNLQLTS